MNPLVEKVIESIPVNVFTDVTVQSLTSGSPDSRYGLVKRAIKSGDIIHLRKGLYLLAKKYRRASLNLYEVAQLIYGPSYISFESALSYHGWIPEAVYTTTSATLKRSREFKTPIGVFSYTHIPSDHFFAGVERMASNGVYLMATPWRALTDYLYINKKRWEGLNSLIEDLRIDKSKLESSDSRLLDELANATRSLGLKKIIKSIQKELHL